MARKLADADFIDYVGHYDVLFLSETWITNKETYNLDIQGYYSEDLFGNKSKGVKIGGSPTRKFFKFNTTFFRKDKWGIILKVIIRTFKIRVLWDFKVVPIGRKMGR